MLCRVVGVGYGQSVLRGIPSGGIVVRVVDFLVHNGLDGRVLGGVDLQAAAVEQVVCLCLRVAQFFHQGLFNLLGQLVRKIAVRSSGFLRNGIHILDAGVYVVGECLLLLLLGDITLLIHVLQDDLTLFLVLFPPGDGI